MAAPFLQDKIWKKVSEKTVIFEGKSTNTKNNDHAHSSPIKDIAELRGYQLVLDRASDSGIIFGSPKIDISNEVLKKLGYSTD